MTIDELFNQSKEALGIYTNYQDKQLKPYFNDVIAYLKSAGVSENKILSESAVGVVARGLSDLWSYGAGTAKLSQYFYERAAQLALDSSSEVNEGGA